MKQILSRQLSEWLADAQRPRPLLLDVRETPEFEHCRIPGSVHMPMHTVPMRLPELAQDSDIVVICHHGGRSAQVAYFLEGRGYTSVFNLAGGVEAWACEVDTGMPRY